MQKPPLAEAQTALGKQKKHILWKAGIYSTSKILRKSCFLTQNFTEIGQSVAESWPKIISKMAAVRHLKF